MADEDLFWLLHIRIFKAKASENLFALQSQKIL